MGNFQISNNLVPSGDQPNAINGLIDGIEKNKKRQILLGVTGSGKTYTVANVIAKYNKNTLVISHNKTLSAQLYAEFKEFFPNNNVGYFVSFYDYYQPESYLPQTDTYIEKDTEINEKIEQMRLESTSMLLSGDPTIIIATVSCIYSLGSPHEWREQSLMIKKEMEMDRRSIIRNLIKIRYERNDINLTSGSFSTRGDIIDIIPGYSEDIIRINLFGQNIEKITVIDKITKEIKKVLDSIMTNFLTFRYERFRSIKTSLK